MRALVVVVSLLLASVASADLVADAEAAWAKRDWPRAAAAYDELARREPTMPRHWMRLGLALHRSGKLDRALVAYERAIAQKAPAAGLAHYNIACILAASPVKVNEAFSHLETAVKLLATTRQTLVDDPDLAPLRALDGGTRWAALLALEEATNHPCRQAATFRQFDFWLGAWDVYSGGQKVGTSQIDAAADGCLVVENWQSVQAHSGKSLNWYSPRERRWRQTWVGSGGDTTEFAGVLAGGEMRFSAEQWSADGQPFLRKLTFSPLPDGTVRQHGERSDDGGKTWLTDYDFLYRHPAPGTP